MNRDEQTNQVIVVESLLHRYATKSFDVKEVDEQMLSTIAKAFRLTPTSYGLLPIRLVIIDRATARAIDLEKLSYNQRQVEEASHVLLICTEKIDKNFIDTHFKELSNCQNISTTVLLSMQAKAEKMFLNDNSEVDNRRFAENQAYIALGNLLTSLAILGIDACPMEGFDKSLVDAELDLKMHNLRSCLMIPIGYRNLNDKHSDVKKFRRNANDTVLHIFRQYT